MLRILVTGAAGFIGSHLCERLLEAGHRVWGLDNLDDFYAPDVKLRNLRTAAAHPHMQVVEGDVRDSVLLGGLLGDVPFDVVVHLAARPGVRPSIEDPAHCYDVNVVGTLTLLEAMREHHAGRLVFGSSSSVYGDRHDIPFEETATVDRPISPYAASKCAGEQMCFAFHHLHGFSVHCLRFFTVFGPRQRPDLAIHKFTRLMTRNEPLPLFGDGTTARDYTYVDDTVDGVVRSIQVLTDRAGHDPAFEIVNLGRSDAVTLRRLVDELSAALEVEPELEWLPTQPGDVTITCASAAKARSLLGFEPRISLSEGLARFARWYREVAEPAERAGAHPTGDF